jgi:hypothetical protein
VSTALKDQEKSLSEISLMASSQITSGFFVPPHGCQKLKNEKAFFNGMCQVNVRKTDIQQLIKYTDQDNEIFWTSVLV